MNNLIGIIKSQALNMNVQINGGMQGVKGDTGIQGIQGVAGVDGTNGIDGSLYDDTLIKESVALNTSQLTNYATYASVKDGDIYTVIDFKRSDATLYLKSTLSNKNANGYFQTCVLQYYDAPGTTITKTVTWTFAYDVDGNIITKVVA